MTNQIFKINMERLKEIQKLKNDGLTFKEIGLKFSLSKQRIYQILNPEYQRAYSKTPKRRAYQRAYQRAYSKTPKYRAYQRAYSKTPKYRAYQRAYSKTPKRRAYQRHVYHLKVSTKFNNCERCKK